MTTISAELAVRRRSNTQERLLNAAFDLFAEAGAAGTTVEVICERAGFTRGAFYSNFANKDELFLALVRREFDRRIVTVSDQGPPAPTLRQAAGDHDRLASLMQPLFPDHGDDQRWVILLSEFRRYATLGSESARLFAEKRDELMGRLGRQIAAMAQEVGVRFVVADDEVARIALAVYSEAVADATLDAAAGRPAEDRAELSHRIALVVKGLLAPAPDDGLTGDRGRRSGGPGR